MSITRKAVITRKILFFILWNLLMVEVLLQIGNRIYPLEIPNHLRDSYKNEWLEGRDWLDGENRLYAYKPNTQGVTHGHPFRANSWGFRGEEFLKRDLEGWNTFRIMVLGDSLTMGQGIREEDRYTNILSVRLRERYPDQKIEVINLGVQGFETVQEEKMLQRMWDIVRPNLTIVGFFWNDTNISYYYSSSYKIPIPERLRYYLRKIIIFRIVDSGYNKLYKKFNKIPMVLEEVKRSYNTDSHDWKIFEQSVKGIANFVIDNTGKSPLVIYLAHMENYKSHAPYRNVRDTFEKNGFIWVEVDMESFQYFPVSRFEGHPNEETHASYAKALFDKIVELNLLLK